MLAQMKSSILPEVFVPMGNEDNRWIGKPEFSDIAENYAEQ